MQRKETTTTSGKDVEITHFHSSGKACSREGFYVSGGIPGERLRIRPQRGKGFRSGSIVQIISPSPERTVPFCVHAALCGGCPWQHIRYRAQLKWKRDILMRALEKYGISLPENNVPEVVPSPLLTGYRNRVDYTFEAGAGNGGNPIMGFHLPGDPSSVFDCRECLLLPPGFHSLAMEVRETARDADIPFYRFSDRSGLLRNVTLRCTTTGDIAVIPGFTRNRDDRIASFMETLSRHLPKVTTWGYTVWDPLTESGFYNPAYYHYKGKKHLEEQAGDLRFQYSPQAFYQPNPLQAAVIFREIRELTSSMNLESGPVFDLYTGIGTIALSLTAVHKNASITGIEGNSPAVNDARRNVPGESNGNIHFICGDILETFTTDFTGNYQKPSLIVLDPPRSGTLTEIKKTILQAKPDAIIYLSCNPVSLAWDLKQFTGGGYRVTHIRPFDMFPHTHHVETLTVCEPVF